MVAGAPCEFIVAESSTYEHWLRFELSKKSFDPPSHSPQTLSVNDQYSRQARVIRSFFFLFFFFSLTFSLRNASPFRSSARPPVAVDCNAISGTCNHTVSAGFVARIRVHFLCGRYTSPSAALSRAANNSVIIASSTWAF